MRPQSSLSRPLLVGVVVAVLLAWPAGTLAQDAATDPLPERGTVLEAGRYESSFVGPTIDFRAEEGWVVGPSGGGPIFTLEHTSAPGTVLTVTRFDGETYLDSCDSTSMIVVEPSVQRLAEIIAGNPYLNAGAPRLTEVDGHTGLTLDVGVPSYTECGQPNLLIWALPMDEGGDLFVQYANQQSRFVILDVGGDVIVIAIESFPGVPYAGLLEASIPLIESMRIEPGEYIPPEPAPEPSTSPEPSPLPPPSPQPESASPALSPEGSH